MSAFWPDEPECDRGRGRDPKITIHPDDETRWTSSWPCGCSQEWHWETWSGFKVAVGDDWVSCPATPMHILAADGRLRDSKLGDPS